MFDPTVTYEDLAWIREQWPGKVSVKGVQTVADAVRLADAGVDAIILSNHGGRQLDRAPVPFHLLPEVVKEVGSDLEVHLDTGIMSGQDIVAAIAHGARFTLVGRAYLYGLMAGGRPGVDRTIEIPRARSSAPCACSASALSTSSSWPRQRSEAPRLTRSARTCDPAGCGQRRGRVVPLSRMRRVRPTRSKTSWAKRCPRSTSSLYRLLLDAPS